MKKLIALLALIAIQLNASQVVTLTITVTNLPTDDEYITVNGSQRTWNTTAASITEISTGTNIGLASTNLFLHIAANPFSQLTLGFSSTNIITLRGGVDQSITAVQDGDWCSLVLSTQTVATLRNVAVPLASMPTATTRTNIASDLVTGLNDYSTNAISATSTLASNLVGLANAQTVTGAKSFTNSTYAGYYYDFTPATTNAELGLPVRASASGNFGPSIFAKDVGSGIMRPQFHDGDVSTLQILTTNEASAYYLAKSGGTMTAAGTLSFGTDTNLANLQLPLFTTNSNPNEVSGAIYYDAGDEQIYTYSNSEGVWVSAYRWLQRMFSDTSSEPTGNPTNGVFAWSYDGELKYRGDTASEGAGANNRIHNRAAEVVGSGSDYSLTQTYARTDFGGTDPQLALPTAGTYLVEAVLAVTTGNVGGDAYYAKFYDSTAAADIANSEAHSQPSGTSSHYQMSLKSIITVTGASTIQIYSKNASAARGSIESIHTKLIYVRLY